MQCMYSVLEEKVGGPPVFEFGQCIGRCNCVLWKEFIILDNTVLCRFGRHGNPNAQDFVGIFLV